MTVTAPEVDAGCSAIVGGIDSVTEASGLQHERPQRLVKCEKSDVILKCELVAR